MPAGNLPPQGQPPWRWTLFCLTTALLWVQIRQEAFDQLTADIQAEKDVHAILVTANDAESAWTVLKEIASAGKTAPAVQSSRPQLYQYRYREMSKVYADELLRVRSAVGDAAALQIAHSSEFYPTIVKENKQ